jgi:ABC-type lipoprotein release transport system permease subunit
MIWSIAWKNLWRNKRRSLVVIAAVTIGIISGVLLIGIMKGWIEQRLHDAIYNEASHIQIHNKEFIQNEEVHLTIKNPDEITRCLESLQGISGWGIRTKIIAMANTSWANTGVNIYGINPDKERQVTEIYKEIIPGAGEYLDHNRSGEILISDKTAEILKLKHYIITEQVIAELQEHNVPETIIEQINDLEDLRFRSPKDFREALKNIFAKKELDRYGSLIMDAALDYRIRSKIQLTLSDEKGNPVQGIFRVCGIYKTTNTGFDQVSVFVNDNELASLCGYNGVLPHEIAILLSNEDEMMNVKENLSRISPDNIVRTWKELAPDAAMMNDFMIIYYFLFIGIIMLALAFGIINTMLMSVLERTKELGMLMAIGMNRRRIFGMIMMETVFLTIVGAITGMISGWMIIRLLGRTGIHFTGWGEGFEAIGFAAKVFPVVTFDFFMTTTIIVIFTAILSSIWPARKALSLNPVETLRTD